MEGSVVVSANGYSIDAVLDDVIAQTRARELSCSGVSCALELFFLANEALELESFQSGLVGMLETHCWVDGCVCKLCCENAKFVKMVGGGVLMWFGVGDSKETLNILVA